MQAMPRFAQDNGASAPRPSSPYSGKRRYRAGRSGGLTRNAELAQAGEATRSEAGQTPGAQSDQELVARMQAGDKRAFNALAHKYQHKLFKVIARYIHDPEEALDVTQETFIRAYRALPNFRGDSGFYTWLYRIGLNMAKNHLAVLARRLPDSDIDLQEAERYEINFRLKDYGTPEALTLRDEIEQTVSLALTELPEDLRTAISLRELKGLTYKEVAQVTGSPRGTVRSRIYRAREAIDKRLRLLRG